MHRRFMAIRATALALAIFATQFAGVRSSADAAGDKKRAQLLPVKRLLVVPPFVATDTLGELPPLVEPKGRPVPPLTDKRKAELETYTGVLKQLEEYVRARTYARATVRLPFSILSATETQAALKSELSSVPQLFATGGRLKGRKFDEADAKKVQKLAEAAHADAVLIGSLDEPRKSNGHYYFDPLAGAGYESPKVSVRGEFALYLANGTLVLKHSLEEFHPVTQLGKQQFLLADWIETEELLVEDLMDEITRYTPIKPTK